MCCYTGELTSPSTDSGTTTTAHLTILTILKSLAVGLLLTGDFVAAGILLHTILPHIAYVDSLLYSVLTQLPAVTSVSVSSSGTSDTGGGGDSIKQMWALSSEQLNALFNALVN